MREKQTRQASGREHMHGCHVAQLWHKPGPSGDGRSRKGWNQPGSLRLGTATKSRLALPPKNGYSHTKLAHQPREARR